MIVPLGHTRKCRPNTEIVRGQFEPVVYVMPSLSVPPLGRCMVVGQFAFKCRMGHARLIYGSVWAKPTLWSWFICYFTGINVVTLMVFFYDKRIAGRKGVVRVPENALFLADDVD